MAIEIKMPALSPTMEEGTLARWLVGEGDTVRSGDLLAEIETDKATMEIEAVDEGVIAKLIAAEGADGLKVGTVIALLVQGDEEAIKVTPPRETGAAASPDLGRDTDTISADPPVPTVPPVIPPQAGRDQPNASAFVLRLARQQGIDLRSLTGSGVDGRIVKADLLDQPASDSARAPNVSPMAFTPMPIEIPHQRDKLSEIRAVVARSRAVAKQQVPHIYLTQDVRLDALLELRVRLNEALSPRGVKLSINDLLVKALALALVEVPACNASFAGDNLIRYDRVDISVAVAGALVWPVIVDASNLTLSTISSTTKDLALRAREGRLMPEEHRGGTASLSNLGMFGIKQFGAAINPPQAMILAIGAGERRPRVVDGTPGVATVMSVTGSFDHRAVDGADGARLMGSFRRLIEDPRALLV